VSGRGAEGRSAALARKVLWRGVLTLTGGLRVRGARGLPDGPCVIVANHCSHADTAALIAALPARRRPVVAAAADYWFRGAFRAKVCGALCGAFPVRRSGGGSADLEAAAGLLAAGHDVIVYPEGTRSRDGEAGEFHRGAARLAATAGVPLVPCGISGTRRLLPPGGSASRPRRAAVTVRIGASMVAGDGVSEASLEARARVVALATGRADGSGLAAVPRDSALRVRVARFAGSRRALLLAGAWAFGEALSWPLLPYLAALAVVVTGGLWAVVSAWS
jgi:1-acyl-sn-glycerol-3-phosphate acyltransferase